MAYRKQMSTTCYTERCTLPATYRVYNNRNGLIGEYCPKCSQRKVVEIGKIEVPDAK